MKKRLLASLVSLAMLFTLLPVSAFAADGVDEGTEVDTLSNVSVKSVEALKQAIESAEKKTTITLDADIEAAETVTIARDNDIILDLGNRTYTITGNHPAITVESGGSLEVTGEGVMQRTDGVSQYVILNHGTMTLTGGTLKSNAQASTLRNATPGTEGAVAAKMTINGGEVTGEYIAIKNDCVNVNAKKDFPQLTINAGMVAAGADQAVQNWGIATINGGTFSGCVATWSDNEETGDTTIRGGTFNMDASKVVPCAVLAVYLYKMDNAKASLKVDGNITVKGTLSSGLKNDDGSDFIPAVGIARGEPKKILDEIPSDVTVKLLAGTYSSDVSKYLSEGYYASRKADGTFVVSEEQANELSPDSIFAAALHDANKDTNAAIPDEELYENGSYKVEVEKLLAGKDKINTVKIAVNNLKKHANSAGTVGYWAGFAIQAPEGATGVKKAFSANLDDLAVLEEKELEEISDGIEGYTFYTNVGDVNQKRYAAIQFLKEDDAFTDVYRFEIDTTGVIPYTTVTPNVAVANGTARSEVSEKDITDMIDAAVNDKSVGTGTEKKVPTVTIDAKGSGTSVDAKAAEVTIPSNAANALQKIRNITLKVETPVGSVELPANKLPSAGDQNLTVVIAKNNTVQAPINTTVEAYDIEVRKGSSSKGEEITCYSNESIKVSVKTELLSGYLYTPPLYALYIPDSGKPQIVDKQVEITDDGIATFEVPHLSTYALATKRTAELMDAEDATQPDDVRITYQIGSGAEEEPMFSSNVAIVNVPVGTGSVTINATSANNRKITINDNEVSRASVSLLTDPTIITVMVGSEEYTIIVGKGTDRPAVENVKVTWTSVPASNNIYYMGMLSIRGLDRTRTYLVTYDNANAVGNNVPRVGTAVSGVESIDLSCQSTSRVIVWRVADGKTINNTTDKNVLVPVYWNVNYGGNNANLGIQANKIAENNKAIDKLLAEQK